MNNATFNGSFHIGDTTNNYYGDSGSDYTAGNRFAVESDTLNCIYYDTWVDGKKAGQEEFPIQNFGKEEIPDVIVGQVNLNFEGTIVENVQTEGSIEMTEATITNASAGGQIKATQCTLETVKSIESSVDLSTCTFSSATAAGSVKALHCSSSITSAALIQAAGSGTLTNCSNLSAEVGGSCHVTNCTKLVNVTSGGTAKIIGSTVDTVKAGEGTTVDSSTINTFACLGTATITQSTVGNVTATGSKGWQSIMNNKLVQMTPPEPATIILMNTNVENITFEGLPGKVFLKGTSAVTGTITNGSIALSRRR